MHYSGHFHQEQVMRGEVVDFRVGWWGRKLSTCAEGGVAGGDARTVVGGWAEGGLSEGWGVGG
jgi:hypothetical protein